MAVDTLNKIGQTLDMLEQEDNQVIEELRQSINRLIDDLNVILAGLDARITTLEP